MCDHRWQFHRKQPDVLTTFRATSPVLLYIGHPLWFIVNRQAERKPKQAKGRGADLDLESKVMKACWHALLTSSESRC